MDEKGHPRSDKQAPPDFDWDEAEPAGKPDRTATRPTDPASRPFGDTQVGDGPRNTSASGGLRRTPAPQTSNSTDAIRRSNPDASRMRLMTRPDAGQPVTDKTQIPEKSTANLVTSEHRFEELQAAEEARLRRPVFLDRTIERLASDSPARQLLVALADSFLSQLVLGLLGTVVLVMILHGIDPTARFAGPLLYLYFISAALYFARFPTYQSLLAASGLCLTGFLMFTVQVSSGAGLKPLLAFKPTALFWMSVCLVSGFSTSLFNRHVEDLLARRAALLTLQKQIRDREERAGKAVRGEKVEENISIIKKAEDDKKALAVRYSSLFLHMQRLSQRLDPDELLRSVWSILKSWMKASECQIYMLKANKLELTHAFRADAKPEGAAAFAENALPPDVMPLDKMDNRTIALGSEATSLFAHVISTKRSVLFEDVARDKMLEQLAAKNPVPVAFCFPLYDVRAGVVKGIINVSKCDVPALDEEARQILRTLADLSAMALSHWEALEEERGKKLELKKLFSTMVSPAVVQQLMDNPALAEPRRQKITVVFVDLRGFTSISEAHSPSIVVSLLTRFFGQLTPLIFQHDGTFDKYIGDEIMALWGAPAATPHDARKAVAAAFAMRDAFAKVQEEWAPKLKQRPEIGIAINTGEAMVGMIGSEAQRNYTAIGDAVNTAARLEGCTGPGKIFITKSTWEEVQDMVEGEWQQPVRVQGKAEALEMFDVQVIRAERVLTATPGAAATPAVAAPRVSSRDLARQVHGGTTPGAVRAPTNPASRTTGQTAVAQNGTAVPGTAPGMVRKPDPAGS